MANLIRFVGCSLLMPAPVAAANVLGWPDGVQLPVRIIALAAVWALSSAIVWAIWPGEADAADEDLESEAAPAIDGVAAQASRSGDGDDTCCRRLLRPALA